MYQDIRITTGNPAVDSAVSGGIPAGSAVLLLSDTGAGGNLLMQTMLHQVYLNKKRDRSDVPKELCYISAKKSPDALINELRRSFHLKDSEAEGLLSHLFNAGVPKPGSLSAVLEKAVSYPAVSLVFLDSLTAYLSTESDFASFISLMNRTVRTLSERKVTCIFLLAAGALPHEEEVQLSDLFDHVWRLSWDTQMQKPRRLLSLECGVENAAAAPHEMLQMNAVLLPEGGIAVSNLRKIV